MPIDPELAKEADAGMIEVFAGDYLDNAARTCLLYTSDDALFHIHAGQNRKADRQHQNGDMRRRDGAEHPHQRQHAPDLSLIHI